jgi:hypothetical protein
MQTNCTVSYDVFLGSETHVLYGGFNGSIVRTHDDPGIVRSSTYLIPKVKSCTVRRIWPK